LDVRRIGATIRAEEKKGYLMRRIPVILTVAYLAIVAIVLVKNVIWSIGDQTDVIRVGLATFPIGLILSFVYPGGRNGAFVAVSLPALLNAAVIFYLSRWVTRRFSNAAGSDSRNS
jgi:hypothetical protein